MQYMVVYNVDEMVEIDAKDLRDCIIKFAEYVGDLDDLFIKALKGCESDNDYIKMYERFGSYHIDKIFIIQETVYNDI